MFLLGGYHVYHRVFCPLGFIVFLVIHIHNRLDWYKASQKPIDWGDEQKCKQNTYMILKTQDIHYDKSKLIVVRGIGAYGFYWIQDNNDFKTF